MKSKNLKMQKIKLLLLLAVLALLTGACSKQWCNSHYAPSVDSIYKYVTRDSIIIKDTTIYLYLPGEIVYDSVQIPCPDPGPAYIPKRVTAETSLAKASAWFQFPNIKLELIQKDTTIVQRLDDAIKEAYYWKSEYQKITVKPEPVKFIPTIYKVTLWLWIGVLIAVAGYIALRLFVFKK